MQSCADISLPYNRSHSAQVGKLGKHEKTDSHLVRGLWCSAAYHDIRFKYRILKQTNAPFQSFATQRRRERRQFLIDKCIQMYL